MRPRQQILFSTILLMTSPASAGAARCPGAGMAVQYHSPDASQLVVSVTVNRSGPYEFMVDTGAQMSIIEPSLAAELHLQPQGSLRLLAVRSSCSSAVLVAPELVELGLLSVRRPLMLVADLSQIQAFSRRLRGILGENFLVNFDLLIDRRHKLLCFDTTKTMQQNLTGEQIPMLSISAPGSPVPDPVLIPARLRGDGATPAILLLDSGTNAPVLYGARVEAWRLTRRDALQGCVAGQGPRPTFAALPDQDVQIGRRIWPIGFFVLLDAQATAGACGEDGLLPAMLFQRIFISHTGRFVIFDPQLTAAKQGG